MEKPETASVQRESIPLKSEPAPEDVTEELEDADESETPEPQRNFATQRESIEDLPLGGIQHFQTILDCSEPTSSLYPIIVRAQTPPSTNCIEGWAMIQEGIEAGQATIRCRIYDLAEASEEELAIRKLSIRILPEGGVGSYSEILRNYTKCKELLLSTNESLGTFAHGGARRGIEFASATEHSVNRLLAIRLGKSEETTRKYSLHGSYLNDRTFQELVEQKADSKFFQSVQKVKSKLVKNLEGARLSHEDIVGQVSQEILRLHRAPEETRNQIIKNLLESLTRTQSGQGTSTTQTATRQAAETAAHEEEGGEPQKREEGREPEEIEPEEGAEEEEEQAAEEEIADLEEPSEPPAPAPASSEPQEQQAFNDVEIRDRAIAICEELKGHLANREISLSEAKERIRILIQTLEPLLDLIPDP